MGRLQQRLNSLWDENKGDFLPRRNNILILFASFSRYIAVLMATPTGQSETFPLKYFRHLPTLAFQHHICRLMIGAKNSKMPISPAATSNKKDR